MINKCNIMGFFVLFFYFTTLTVLSLAINETSAEYEKFSTVLPPLNDNQNLQDQQFSPNSSELLYNMPPLDQDETQRRINEAKAKTAQARKAMKDASDLANYITKPFENGMKSVDKVLGYVETGIDIFNIVMVVVICGSIMLCIISPLIYIITTLITSISQCVAQCKSNKNQETDDYTKLNERILFIETNNGLKPAATGDKNQNDVTGEGGGGGHGKGASQRPSAKKGVQEGSGGATSGAAASGPGVSGGGNSTVKSTAKSVDAKEQQKS